MIRVLFVCLGNTCRSPMAEAVFLQKVREANLESWIQADSAGTGCRQVGAPAHLGTRHILSANGIAYDGKSRGITPEDLNAFNYVVTMDEENYDDVCALPQGTATVARFLDYAPQTGMREVPDPYSTDGHEGIFPLVVAGAAGLLASIRTEHLI